MNKIEAFRWKLFNLIRDDDKNNKASNIFDSIIIFLIILNVVIIILDTFKNLNINVRNTFYYIEKVSIIIFTLEYIARVWTAIYIYSNKKHLIARIKYMFTFMAIIDLLAIIPFYLYIVLIDNLLILRVLRLLRFFRLFKLDRYSHAMIIIKNVFIKKSYQLICSICVVFILIILSSVLMYYAEHNKQPDVFENAFSGVWWAIVTLATVGYGDIYPITVFGRIFGAIIALLGIGILAIPTGIITAGFVEQISNDKINTKKNYLKRRYIKKRKKY